jgi:hypothetical protein
VNRSDARGSGRDQAAPKGPSAVASPRVPGNLPTDLLIEVGRYDSPFGDDLIVPGAEMAVTVRSTTGITTSSSLPLRPPRIAARDTTRAAFLGTSSRMTHAFWRHQSLFLRTA